MRFNKVSLGSFEKNQLIKLLRMWLAFRREDTRTDTYLILSRKETMAFKNLCHKAHTDLRRTKTTVGLARQLSSNNSLRSTPVGIFSMHLRKFTAQQHRRVHL